MKLFCPKIVSRNDLIFITQNLLLVLGTDHYFSAGGGGGEFPLW